MKKLKVRYLLIFLLLSQIFFVNRNKSYAEDKRNPLKLIGGIILTGAGIFMAVDGFKQIESSKPGLDIDDWSWSKEQIISWWADAGGSN